MFFLHTTTMISLATFTIPNAPGWTRELYLTNTGDYYIALLKYDNCKADEPYFLDPAGDN